MSEEEMVTITAELYAELLEKDQFLCALECMGVDNWDGYEGAKELVESWKEERNE